MFTVSTSFGRISFDFFNQGEKDLAKEAYHHGDLKTELIRKGLSILNKEGVDAFSMRKVAKACNVSQTAPYRHYKDKEELIAAITLSAMRAFNDHLEQAVMNPAADPKQQLKDLGIAYIRFFFENPEYLQLLFLSDLRKVLANSLQPSLEITSGHPFSILVQTVKRYKASYDDARTEEQLLMYCWGLVHGISILIVRNQLPFQGDYVELAQGVLQNERFL
jgi:AcrR family transcriptional regulator